MATGSLQKRSKGSWTLRFDLGPDPATGRRRQKTMSLKGNKREAEKLLRETLNSLDTGCYVKSEKLTMGQYLTQWLDSYVTPNLRASTAQGYRSIVQHHLIPKLGSIKLQQLEPNHVSQFHAETLASGVSNRTVLNAHKVLSRALNQAVRAQLIIKNPAQMIDAPRPIPKEAPTFSDQQINEILEAIADSPFREAMILAIYTGLRRGEILGLRWKDVDLAFAQLTVNQTVQRVARQGFVIAPPKTRSSRRTIALPPAACVILRGLKEQKALQLASIDVKLSEDDLIFSRIDGKPFEPASLSHAFKRIVRRLGYPEAHFHTLRHFHASKLLRAGTNMKVISQRLGHSNIGTTMNIYAHLMPDQDVEAAQIFEQGLNLRDQTVSKPLHRSLNRGHFETKRL